MKTYLVGGAVRNELLGLPVIERDYVVVGSTEKDMLDAGFTRVGRDFPVFLHPVTKEEHALARTERKTGPGHQGFVCDATPSVTLEEDLLRRDLTINAIAQDTDGSLIDPFEGLQDLKRKVLRHVSDAFTEDPLRVLRVARFKATLNHLGFNVDSGTNKLLEDMVHQNLLDELAPERIFAELVKALKTDSPGVFFEYLVSINAHDALWPEITMDAIARLGTLSTTSHEIRFISLAAYTDDEKVKALCSRLKCSRHLTDLSLMLARHLPVWRTLPEMSPTEIYDLLELLDAFRRAERFTPFNQIAELVTTDNLAERWQAFIDIASDVTSKSIPDDIVGPAIGQAIRSARIAAITQSLETGNRDPAA